MAEAPAPGAIPAPSPAEVRVYRNRQERRQDSPKREIASGVGVAVIGDLEYSTERLRPAEEGVTRSQDDSFSQSLELELEIKRSGWLHAAVVWEYTHDEEGGRDRLSEAFITLMAGDFELEVGRLFAPFGEYLSYFATGPALEFAETGLEGGVLSYGPSNRFDASLFGFKGEHRGMVGRTGRWDWGLALEFAPREKLRFGLGYLSDLAEAGEGLLERGARYERRVAGWNGFVEISAGPFTGTAEIVRALDSFVELEAEVDRPTA